MTYSEKLKDPRWQKKRLEVLNRDEFKCTLCGDDKTELHVHHKKYHGEPWEAKNESLETLCKDCHGLVEFCKSKYLHTGNPIKIIKTVCHGDDAGFDIYFHALIDCGFCNCVEIYRYSSFSGNYREHPSIFMSDIEIGTKLLTHG